MSKPNTATSSGSCRMCGAEASTRCSRCKDEFYCCKEHIASDWKRHKRLCIPAEGVQARPITMDAILFPVDEDRPRIVKVPCEVMRDEEPDIPAFSTVHRLNMEEWFDLKGDTFVRPMDLGGGAVMRLPGPGYNLDIAYDDNSLVNGSPLNRCIQSLTRRMAPHSWAGNILARRSEKPLTYCMRYYNANMKEDLPRVVEFFMGYGTDRYKYDPDAAHKWGGPVEELEY